MQAEALYSLLMHSPDELDDFGIEMDFWETDCPDYYEPDADEDQELVEKWNAACDDAESNDDAGDDERMRRGYCATGYDIFGTASTVGMLSDMINQHCQKCAQCRDYREERISAKQMGRETMRVLKDINDGRAA